MILPGQFNVTSTGAFTYSIPIVVPPGTAQLTPSLSLDYSSRFGDGPEGFGWELTGLPTIAHCARTTAQDHIHGGINYDTNDRYCMNGQRLVSISGTYGADGTQYRTEIESFAKIISHGTAGNGPAWFEVHTKSGQTIQFGDTADSSPHAVGKTTVRAWAVNKISDTKGNYLTVTYTNDQTNGQAYPTRVDYTGNASAGLSTFASVQFSYTTRSDVVPYYQAGSLTQTTVLLNDIKTYYGAALVSDYKLAYRNATSAATHDELTSVTRCDGSGNCLAPTTFGWQGSRDTLTMTTSSEPLIQCTTPSGGTMLPIGAGDFDGDGITDAIVPTYNSIPGSGNCPANTPSFYAGPSFTGYTPNITEYNDTNHTSTTVPFYLESFLTNSFPVNFSGNQSTDIASVVSFNSYSRITPYVHTSTGWVTHSSASYQILQFVGDFDGDGRTDIAAASPTNPNVGGYYLSNGDGTFTYSAQTIYAGGAQDFDGDGCADNYYDYYLYKIKIVYGCHPAATSYSGTVAVFSGSTGQAGLTFGDFNGDGKTDFIDSNGNLWLSTGTGLIQTGYTLPAGCGRSLAPTGDFNGDGKTDLLLSCPSNGSYALEIFLSTGRGFIQVPNFSIPDDYYANIIADWNNDGAADIWHATPTANTLYSFAYVPELMNSVNNGIGGTTAITYDRLNRNSPFYTKGTSATYPTQDVDGAQYVVSRIDSSNGLGPCVPPSPTNCHSATYAYAGAQTDHAGRGFLGFAQVAITDMQTGIVQTTNYDTLFPFTGVETSQTKVAPKTGGGTVTLSSMVATPEQISLGTGTDGVARTFVATHSTVLTRQDEDFSTGNVYALPTVTTTTTYDCDGGGTSPCSGTSPTGFGNVTALNVALSDGSSRTTTNTYTNNSTYWLLGRLTLSTLQSIVPGSPTLTRTSSAAFDLGGTTPSGLVTAQTLEPTATNNLYQSTAIGYDAFGNKTSETQSSYTNSFGVARTTSTAYDTTTYHGQFPTKVTNALSQYETFGYNTAFGVPTSHTDLNSLTTNWSIDTFGRQTLETRPDGNKTATAYAFCAGVNGGTASCPTNASYAVTTTPENSSSVQNGPISITYYDALGRIIATDVQGFDGSVIRTATQYDAVGHVGQTSRPYFVSGGTPKWTVFTYDPLDRVVLTTFPDSSTTIDTYCGLTSSVTNGDHQIKTTVKNAQDLNASIVESDSGACNASGQTTAYVYDAFGNLASTTDPSSNVSTSTYDLRGRRTASNDPDMGNWSYSYDAYSQLTSQTNANGQTTNLTYDLLGRVTQRVEPGLTSNWVYDTATKGVGQLASACTGTGCTTPATSSYFRAYTYDSLARPASLTLTIGGTNYAYASSYNSDGRLDTETYPSGFVAKNVYNSYGYLFQVKDNVSGTAYYTANTRDAELHLTQETAGNAVLTTQQFDPNTGRLQWTEVGTVSNPASFETYTYNFDVIGNLLSRQDTTESYTEYFCYDALNRLQYYAIGGSCTASGYKTMAYDALGNITSKSDVGSYTYGSGGPGPHAVVSISGTVNGVVNPNFAYDANGNLTCEYTGSSCTGAGIARSVSYSAFDMASSITEGSNAIALTYDSEHARISQVLTGSPASTTLYLNDPTSGAMSENFTSGGVTTWRDYIRADDQIVAMRSCVSSAPPCTATPTTAYFTLDHLNSVSLITDDSGAIAERDSYDAWGKRRNADGSDASSCTITAITTRGFTNQEMMDSVCLVNLNARIYDPVIGRFMAPDSVVQDAYSPQMLNRYTYVDNGPLSFTDPTGHDINPGKIPGLIPNTDAYPSLGCEGTCSYSSSDDSAAENAVPHQPSNALTSGGQSGDGVQAAPANGDAQRANPQGDSAQTTSQDDSTAAFGQNNSDQNQVVASLTDNANSKAGSSLGKDNSSLTPSTGSMETVVVTAEKRQEPNNAQNGKQLQGFPSDYLVFTAGGWAAAEVGGVFEAVYAGARLIKNLFSDSPNALRPKDIPDDWIEEPSRKGGGTEYINPRNTFDRVRVMPGNPESPNAAQQRPYVLDQVNGRFLTRNGQRIEGGSTPDTHIPLDEYQFSR